MNRTWISLPKDYHYVKQPSALSAREVYQQLRDAAMGTRSLRPVDDPAASDGQRQVDIEGWRITLEMTDNQLGHCRHCRSPEGREGSFDSWLRTDPFSLLSAWEQAQIEQLLGRTDG
ncbi:hypothetical protein KDX38_05585 [Pseudomonas sp. CDFA 602]|nr:hypothetical protein [Pseudomonas californiensis]MCD5998683.1 hypothetical protein [Pseudomonas californiensis]